MPTFAELASAALAAKEPYGPTASAALNAKGNAGEYASAQLPANGGYAASIDLAAKIPSYAEYDSAHLGTGGGSAGPSMPAGADGLWVMSDYSLADRGAVGANCGVVKNRMAATPPSKNLISLSRGGLSTQGNLNNSGVVLAEGSTAADGSPSALKISWTSGDQYSQIAIISMPAGTYRLSFDAISDDATSTFAGRAGVGNAETVISVGPTWSRISVPVVMGAPGSPNLMLFRTPAGNSGSGSIRVDNVTLHQGAVDLGADVFAGHLMIGTSAFSAAPGLTTAGALDASGGAGGTIQFPTARNLTAFTVIAVAARTQMTAGGGQKFAIISKAGGSNAWNQFSALVDDGTASGGRPDLNFGTGSTFATLDPAGFWNPRANEFHAYTNRYGTDKAVLFLDEARTHEVAAVGRSATVQTFWYAAYNSALGTTKAKFAAIAYWPRELTDAEVREAVAYLKAEVALSGIAVGSNPRLGIFEGDSLTVNQNSYAMKSIPNLTAAVSGVVAARNSAKLTGNSGNSLQGRAVVINKLVPPNKAGKVYVLSILIGANDLNGYSGGTSQYLIDLSARIAVYKANGVDKIVLCTALPQTAPGFNAVKAVFNSAIKAPGWAAANGVDAISDFDSVISDADAADPSKFPDGLHPTDAVHLLMEPVFRAAWNSV